MSPRYICWLLPPTDIKQVFHFSEVGFIADCVVNATFFKVQTLQQMMKQIPAFEEQVWR